MPDFDSAFLAFPSRELAGAALERAKELGAEHADFRLERTRAATLALHDARVESSSDREDVGLAVRVIHNGAWGFASGIARTAGRGCAAGRAGGGHREGQPGAQLGAGRAGRRAGLRRRDLDLGLRRQPVRHRRVRPRRPARRTVRATARRRRRRPRRRAGRDRAGEQVLRRRARHGDHPATRAGQSRSSPRCTSTARPARSSRCARLRRRRPAAGSTSPAPAGTSTPRSPSCPNCCASTPRRRASRPARTTWSSIRPTCG